MYGCCHLALGERRRLPSSRMFFKAIGVFVRLGASSEDIEQLRSTWMAERADRQRSKSRHGQVLSMS